MHRNRWHFILPAAALLMAALAAGCAAFAALADPPRLAGETRAASILITDRHGRTLYEAIDPNGSKQVPVPLDEIPPACRHATIATEDSRFYTHPGVDLLGIARALWQSWRKDEPIAGTSTLTQQLARNLYLSEAERTERTLRRKLREAWLAWRLERTHTKDELLALYLNTTYYGHFATGIEAAAQAYFGVHARELDLAQCALLAGLPQSPTAYNPIENLEAAQNRQAVVLRLMVRHGAITAAQAEEAGGERLAFAGTPFPIEAPHFVMWVQSQLETLLGADRVRAGGLRVTTTLDLDWQRQAEAIVARRLAQLKPCAASESAGGRVRCRRRSGAAGGERGAGRARSAHRRGAGPGRQPGLLRPGHQRRGERGAGAAPARLGDQAADLRRRARSRTRPGGRRGAVDRRDDHPRSARRVPHRRGRALRPQQLRPPVPRPGHAAHGPGQLLQHPGGADAGRHRRGRADRAGGAAGDSVGPGGDELGTGDQGSGTRDSGLGASGWGREASI